MKKQYKDLSKPFVNTWIEGKWFHWETNLPNDTIGDFEFEWDIDGVQERKWQEYLKKLEKEGILGNLEYRTGSMIHLPELDDKQEFKTPTQSAKFIIFDISENNSDEKTI